MAKKSETVIIFMSIFSVVLLGFHAAAANDLQDGGELSPGRTMARQAVKEHIKWSTTDHAKHEILREKFQNGSEITKACLTCHSEVASQFHKTVHWTWLAEGGDSVGQYGKAGDSINNYCISTNKMNDKSCQSCHPGWNDKQDGINCLVCHGQKELKWSEVFEDLKYFLDEGDPESQEMAEELQHDIMTAVVSIARPTRKNCGSCHFYGGGGDGVKHGDLDSSLTNPDKSLDVHMGVDGEDFTCTRCHTTKLHNIAGRVYTAPASMDRKSLIENDLASRITCESCHTSLPHQSGSKVNDHTDKVACQSCHISEFARVNPTKMKWDWSKAGKTKDGKPYKTTDEFGKHDYLSIKGEMKWEKNVKPEYFWYNGKIKSLTTKHVIDPSRPVYVSHPEGDPEDANSRIYPFKVHKGVQPYDKKYKTLLAPLLSGEDGFWTTLDFNDAITKGMKYSGLPYSGRFDFVETDYVLPTTHMVSPKGQAVRCNECHTRNGSRLKNLKSFYMPGRDRFRFLDLSGWAVVLISALGVLIHGAGRFVSRNRRKDYDK
ncbi:MAG: tetrathionate reductase family octaheme c-type cytochrome [Desulfobacterales bacterium]